MSSPFKCADNVIHFFGPGQHEPGSDVTRFDFHTLIETRFCDWCSEIDRLQDPGINCAIYRRRVFSLQAFKDVSFYFRRGYPSPFFKR